MWGPIPCLPAPVLFREAAQEDMMWASINRGHGSPPWSLHNAQHAVQCCGDHRHGFCDHSGWLSYDPVEDWMSCAKTWPNSGCRMPGGNRLVLKCIVTVLMCNSFLTVFLFIHIVLSYPFIKLNSLLQWHQQIARMCFIKRVKECVWQVLSDNRLPAANTL